MLNKKNLKKIVGVIFIILGLLALFTPFTPGSWLIPIGLEILGIRLLFWDKARKWISCGGSPKRAD